MPWKHNPDRIPNDEIKQAVLDASRTRSLGSIAKEAGFTRVNKYGKINGDATKLQRAVGLKSQHGGRQPEPRIQYTNKTVHIDVVERIMHALDLDPIDVGL